jgi:uncharacterized protein (DUF1778 family)
LQLSPRTVLINMRVSQDFKDAAEAAAKRDNRSLTSYIETLVLADVRKSGSPTNDPSSNVKKSTKKR